MKRIILLPLLVFSLAAFSQGVIKLNANSSFDLNGFNLTITNGAQIIFRWTPDSSSNRALNNFGGGGGGSTPTLNQYQIGVGDASNLLSGTARFLYDAQFAKIDMVTGTAGYLFTIGGSKVGGIEIDGGTAFIDHYAASGGYTPRFFSNGSVAMQITNTSGLKLNAYGAGTKTGTVAYSLGVTSSGDVIETAGGMANPMTTLGDVIVGGTSGVPTRRAIGSDYQQFLSFGGQPIWSWPRFYPARSIVATDADVSANPGTVITLRTGVLSANRTIEVSSLQTENDYLEIHNNQSGFTWSFSGQSVYLSDRTTTVTSLTANTIYQIRYVDAKLVIIN